jgi:hypothetical protein
VSCVCLGTCLWDVFDFFLGIASRYDVDAFALNIKLPSAVLLREYSLRQHFGRAIEGFNRSHLPYDLKDVLKVRC